MLKHDAIQNNCCTVTMRVAVSHSCVFEVQGRQLHTAAGARQNFANPTCSTFDGDTTVGVGFEWQPGLAVQLVGKLMAEAPAERL